MKGACSTLKEEARPTFANTTKLSNRGAFSIAGMGPWRNALKVSTRVKERPDGGACDLIFQDGGTALALFRILPREFAIGEVVGLADFVRQAFVHEFITAKPEFLAPGPVLELVSQNLFKSRGREVIAPK